MAPPPPSTTIRLPVRSKPSRCFCCTPMFVLCLLLTALLCVTVTSLLWYYGVFAEARAGLRRVNDTTPKECLPGSTAPCNYPTLDSIPPATMMALTQWIERLNAMQSDWTAEINPSAILTPFGGEPWDEEEAITLPPPDTRYLEEDVVSMDTLEEIARQENVTINLADIPKSFDSRVQWPLCQSLNRIYNQGACGSCWAVSATTALSDRVCIHSNGTHNVELSAEHMIDCCLTCGYGCKGGAPQKGLLYWRDHGLVTGGSYASNEGCKPYAYDNDCGSPCDPERFYFMAPTHACTNRCRPGYAIPFEQDKHYGRKVYNLNNHRGERITPLDIKRIQWDILKHGPSTTCFSVYQDFLHYRKGIYHYTKGRYSYGHCVKVIGWGTEKGVDYWLVANSWGRDWGENGYFRIKRGGKAVHFEDLFAAGIPRNSLITSL